MEELVIVDEVVNRWIEKWKQGCLRSKSIQEEWIAWIPKIEQILGNICIPVDTILENCRLEKFFTAILEKFIFYGVPTEYSNVMNKCEEYTSCSKNCSNSYYCYYFICKECEENNVVRTLCLKCFENSEHRRHKYKLMRLSNSGIYCCCGEAGTWEKTWHCKNHLKLSDKIKNSLPKDVESRTLVILEAMILFIDDLLNGYHNLKPYVAENDDAFCVTLHTTSSFINLNVLQKLMQGTLKLTKQEISNVKVSLRKGIFTIKLPKIHCTILQTKLERESNFKVVGVHIYEVIYKEFVVRMISCLEPFLKYSHEIRKIFARLILKPLPTSSESLAEKFIIISFNDPIGVEDKFKKLLIYAVMKDYDSKRSLAEIFLDKHAKFLNVIQRNEGMNVTFHLWIIIQLFTIPTLAYHLIANKNALSIPLIAFLGESEKNREGWKNPKENWTYDMEAVNQSLYELVVLRGLLTTVPITWTKELRVGFLNGMSYFLQALDEFQGIDSMVRKTDIHVEYEQNDLPGRLIISELAFIASFFLKWCKADTEIFNNVYKKTLKMVNERICLESDKSKKMVDFLSYSVNCFPYNTETEPVSIHLPLTRFLVSLHVNLGNFDETVLDPLKFTLMSTFDSILKIYVMVAQYTAGMWNRNGSSLINRVQFYRITRRTEIFDCDIQFLQICASITESNSFLIQLLNKFGLIDWANPNFEENFENDEDQVVFISEQFLQFLISVLIERYVPEVSYVTMEDCVKQQIIHCLCIKPSSHSELTRFVQSTSETVLNDALKEVATLKKPVSVSGQGTYELKKEFFDRFNPLYYHYNESELSEANQIQSLRKKTAGEPDCFPPSKLPKLKEFFAPMINIFQCDVMIHLMQIILVRFTDLKCKSYSNGQLLNILYLIGYALQEEKSHNYSTLSFTEKAAKFNILNCLEKILLSTRNYLPIDLLKWTIAKYKEVAFGMTSAISEESVPTEELKRRRSQLVAVRRTTIRNKMMQQQEKFMIKNLISNKEEYDGNHEANPNQYEAIEKTCILCQESQRLELTNNVLVMAGYVQYSSVLGARKGNIHLVINSPFLPTNLGPAFYTSSCGHIMHANCVQGYLNESWTTNRPSSGFNARLKEFLCPLCSTLSNVLLPVLPPFDESQGQLSPELMQSILKFNTKFHIRTSPGIWRTPFPVWNSLSYTIHVVETITRDSSKPILGHLSSRHHECLQTFVKIAQFIKIVYPGTRVWFNPEIPSLLKGETTKINSHLRYDIFSILVTITFAEINLFDTTNRFETYRLIFVAEIVKVLISGNLNEMTDDINCEDKTTFKCFLQKLGVDLNRFSENFVWKYVQKACLPFLRCCVLLFSFLNDAPSPLQLTQPGGDTFANLCSYLGFPHTREVLFDMTHIYPFVENWFKHPDMTNYLQNGRQRFEAFDPNHINQLVELPHEYFELLKLAESFKRPNYYEEAVFPCLCLVCGQMICTIKIPDGTLVEVGLVCRSQHFSKCAGGLYLKINSCEVMFRPRSTTELLGCSVPAPYLDDYHESDVGLNRCNPLYLSSEKYKQLHTLWLNHGILERFSELTRI